MDESLIGKTAVCSKGKLGVILAIKDLPWGKSYVGVCLIDSGLWASRNPEIVPYEQANTQVEAAFKT